MGIDRAQSWMRSLGIGTGSWTKACSQVIAPSTIHVRPNNTKQKKSVQRRSSFMSSGPVGARAYGVVNSGSAGTDEDDGFNGVVRMLKSLFKGMSKLLTRRRRSSSDRKSLSAASCASKSNLMNSVIKCDCGLNGGNG